MVTSTESNSKPLPRYLDIDNSSTCFASKDDITINTWVSRPNFRYVESYLIKSDPTNKKHSILCLITDGTDRPVHANNGSEPLPFTVNKKDIIGGPLVINERDQLGIIVFNDRPNEFRLDYLEAIKNNYREIFDFDSHYPDVNDGVLARAINGMKKDKDMIAPKEGQGGVIISGG